MDLFLRIYKNTLKSSEKGEMKLKEIYWISGASFFFANCSLLYHEKGIDVIDLAFVV